MTQVLKPDICVIGGGAGGLSVATAAAAFGARVVLIERDRLGGDCLHTGCIPSKALLASARRAEAVRGASKFGLDSQGVTINFAKVRDRVHRVIAAMAPTDSAERLAGLGIRTIREHARFKDRNTVIAGDIEIRSRRFVIAVGSQPAIPQIPGIGNGAYLTSQNIFELAERPEHLIVVGAGSSGLELAQAFRRLGSSVTVLEKENPLGQEDPECVATVVDQLEREGVVIRARVDVTDVAYVGRTVTATITAAGGEQTITGSHLLIAAGRKPAIAGLDLDAAGVRHDATGIRVNKKLKTTNRRIYAIGDCAAGQPRLTHAANYHAGLVIRNALFRLPVRVRIDAIPRVTFTDPELAQAGLTELEARANGTKVRIARWPYHEVDRGQTDGETRGHIKVITNDKGKIVGVTIAGAQAGELVAMWCLAIANRMNIRAIAGLVVPYPTLSELGKRAAFSYLIPGLTAGWVRRIIAYMRILG